jgi:hypothetical protein
MLRLPDFDYVRPASVGEASRMLADRGGNAMAVAGGTDVYAKMKRGQFTPACLVSLRGLAELKGMDVEHPDGMWIGAGETLTRPVTKSARKTWADDPGSGKRRDLERAARDSDPTQQSARQHTAAMAALLQTEDAITAYRRRGHIAETPNGDLKHNKGFRQLSVRGLARTSGELTFTAATLNLFKAISTGHLTHTALDHLTTPPGTPASPA